MLEEDKIHGERKKERKKERKRERKKDKQIQVWVTKSHSRQSTGGGEEKGKRKEIMRDQSGDGAVRVYR
jgi:hypothetical protein